MSHCKVSFCLLYYYISIVFSLKSGSSLFVILPNSTLSTNHIYLEWLTQSHINSNYLEYREHRKSIKSFIRMNIKDISYKYPKIEHEKIYSLNITQLKPGTIYEFKILMDNNNNFEWTEIHSITTLTEEQYKEYKETLKNVWSKIKSSNIPLYALGAVGAVGAATVALPLMGFGTVGVATGSMAASLQTIMVNYGGMTLFSALQSAGAAGITASTQAIIATAGIGITEGIMSWFGYTNDNNDNNDNNHRYDLIKAWFKDKINLYENSMIYYNLFIENGFDSIELISEMSFEDLKEIGIKKIDHIKQKLPTARVTCANRVTHPVPPVPIEVEVTSLTLQKTRRSCRPPCRIAHFFS